jgi:hypothetical protein
MPSPQSKAAKEMKSEEQKVKSNTTIENIIQIQ